MSEEGKSSRWKVWAFLGLALVIVAAAFLLQSQEQGSEGEPAALVEMGEPPVVPGEVEPFVEPADADDEVVLVLPVPPAERDEIEAEAERMMDLPLVPQAIGTEGMVGPPVEPDEIEAEAERMMDLPLVPQAIETEGMVEPPVEPDEIEAGAESMMDLPLMPEAIETEGMVEPPVEPDEIEAVIRAVVREALEARGKVNSGLLDSRETGRRSGVPVLRTLPRMALPVLAAPVRVTRDGMGYRVPLVVRQVVPDQIRGGVYIPAHETYLVVKPGHWEHHKAAVERDGADITEFDVDGGRMPDWSVVLPSEVLRGGP